MNAVLHILPELTKLCRYEKRAAARRDRAIQKVASLKAANKNSRIVVIARSDHSRAGADAPAQEISQHHTLAF